MTEQQRRSILGLSLACLLTAPTGVATSGGRAQLLSAYAAPPQVVLAPDLDRIILIRSFVKVATMPGVSRTVRLTP
jgi:hypothetical protein